MRLPNAPKDSFYYIMRNASEASPELYTGIRAMQKGGDKGISIFDFIVSQQEKHDASGWYSKSENVAFFSWFGAMDYYLKKAPADLVVGEDLATQMYVSGVEDTPYEKLKILEPLQFINVESADLSMKLDVVASKDSETHQRGYGFFKILGFLVIDISRVKSRFFEQASRYLTDAVRGTIYSMTDSFGKEAGIERPKYIMLSVLDSAPDPFGPWIGFNDFTIESGELKALISTSMLDMESDASLPDDEDRKGEIGGFGIAFDIAVKTLLFTQLGEFNAATLRFGKLPVKPKQTKKKKRRGPPPKQVGDYLVTYLSEKSGHTLPWLPSAEVAEEVEQFIEDENEYQIVQTARGRIRIPNHVKLIWVTEGYIERNSIPPEDIYDSGIIGRKRPRSEDPEDMIYKERFLIAKMFTYESGVVDDEGSLSPIKSRVKRLSRKR